MTSGVTRPRHLIQITSASPARSMTSAGVWQSSMRQLKPARCEPLPLDSYGSKTARRSMRKTWLMRTPQL